MSERGLAIVVAIGNGRVIGKDGGLPWKIPEDLRFFKKTTLGHAVVMGRKTFEEVGKPLPERRNIVVSSTLPPREGIEIVRSLDEALELAWQRDPEPRVIGGAGIYEAALSRATKVFITWIDRDVEGDTFFPPFDPSQFRETERRAGETPGVTFVTYER